MSAEKKLAAQYIEELRGDIDTLMEAKASHDDVAAHREQLARFKDDATAKLNEVEAAVKAAEKRIAEAEKRWGRAELLDGGRSKRKSLGKTLCEKRGVKDLLSREKSSAIITLEGGLHRFMRQGFHTRAVTDVDADGLVFNEHDLEIARTVRFHQPTLRQIIPSIVTASDTILYPKLTAVYHLAEDIATQANSGQKDIVLTYAGGVMPGEVYTLSKGEAQEEDITVDSVDYATETVTATANLTNTHAVGRLLTGDKCIFTPRTKTAPHAKLVYGQGTASVLDLRTILDVQGQSLDDAGRFEAELNMDLPPMLARQFERQVFYGNGVATREFEGIFNNSDASTLLMSTGTAGQREAHAIRRGITVGRLSHQRPEVIHTHPNDLEKLDLAATEDGAFLDKLVIDNGQLIIWRTPVRDEDEIKEGDFLVANWSRGARVYDREQASISMSTEHNDNFATEMVSIKAKERLALAFREPKAFVKGSFDSYP